MRSGSARRSKLQSISARSVCWRGSAVLSLAFQQAEPIVEARRDVFDGKRPRSRGGELDRKRNAVELMTDAGERHRVLLRHPERRLRRNGAINEQLHRFVLGERRRGDHS